MKLIDAVMDKNFGFFGRYFAEISFFGEPRKENCTEISFVRFFPTFSDFSRLFPINADISPTFSDISPKFSQFFPFVILLQKSPIFPDKCRYFSDFFRYFSEISTVFSFCYLLQKSQKIVSGRIRTHPKCLEVAHSNH